MLMTLRVAMTEVICKANDNRQSVPDRTDPNVDETVVNCNETVHEFPILNVYSQDSAVRVGNEFRFVKDVLIVVPERNNDSAAGTSGTTISYIAGSTIQTDAIPGTTLLQATKGYRFFRFPISPTQKAIISIGIILAIGLLILLLYLAKPVPVMEVPTYVDRNTWNGRERRCEMYSFNKPTSLVIIQHTTGTFCLNFEECQRSMRNAQSLYQTQNFCDIKFAFAVGGDCRVYEGRNFKQKENWSGDHFYNSSIEVGFIGNYSRDDVQDCQIQNLMQFLESAVSGGFLDVNFKVAGAMQVYESQQQSPGVHLMDKIRTWSRWTNKTFF